MRLPGALELPSAHHNPGCRRKRENATVVAMRQIALSPPQANQQIALSRLANSGPTATRPASCFSRPVCPATFVRTAKSLAPLDAIYGQSSASRCRPAGAKGTIGSQVVAQKIERLQTGGAIGTPKTMKRSLRNSVGKSFTPIMLSGHLSEGGPIPLAPLFLSESDKALTETPPPDNEPSSGQVSQGGSFSMSFMGKKFKGAMVVGLPAWSVEEDCLVVGAEKYPFASLTSKPNLNNVPVTPLTNGTISMLLPGKASATVLTFKFGQKNDVIEAIDYIVSKMEETNGTPDGKRFHFRDKTGSTLDVYDDYVVISLQRTTLLGVSEIIRGGSSGGKRINISDITAVTFREPAGMAVGFIQFAYPGSIERGGGSVSETVNDENSVLVNYKDVELAREIVAFVEERRAAIRNGAAAQSAQTSSADELRKFKDLLNEGIISQDEFNAKKKQLLGL